MTQDHQGLVYAHSASLRDMKNTNLSTLHSVVASTFCINLLLLPKYSQSLLQTMLELLFGFIGNFVLIEFPKGAEISLKFGLGSVFVLYYITGT